MCRQRARLLLAALALVLGVVGPAARNGGRVGADGCAGDGPAPYLHTCGTAIVDASGAPVTLRAVNWYGFDSNDFVAGGLRYQTYAAIIDRIKALGFNSLRIPLSNELIERNPVVSLLGPICAHLSCLPISGADTLGPNGDLYGLDALSILKRVVDYAGSQGLYVILDDHRSEAAWGPQENGLWYTGVTCPAKADPYTCYSAQSWLDDWQKLGSTFAGDPYVTGMDLRNEPHSQYRPYDCPSLLKYAHWGPCGGQNNGDTDWQQAATQAGNLVLSINPHWLVFVEGVSAFQQIDGSFPEDGWGENLQGAAADPVRLGAPGGGDHLVYSPHDYRVYSTNASGDAPSMRAAWRRNFGYLIAHPPQPYSAPLWVGEFGTCTHANNCLVDSAPGSAGLWFSAFTQYLNGGDPANGVPGGTGWSYWPVNGTYSDSWSYSGNKWRSCYGQREDYGVLGGDWSTVAAPLMQALLFPPSPSPTEPPTGTPSPSPQAASATPDATATATPISSTTTLTTTTPTATTTAATSTPRAVSPTPTLTATVPATSVATPTVAMSTSLPASQTPTLTPAPILPSLADAATPTGGPVLPATTAATQGSATPAAPTASPRADATATATATTVTSTATATAAPSATATPMPSATATTTVTPEASATGTATTQPSATPPPADTAVPPPGQWSSVACAPYNITPTPPATATPPIKLTPLAIFRPTATATARPRPTATPVRQSRQQPARKKPAAKKPAAKARPTPAPPLVDAHGSALRRAIRLDVQLRRDGRGRLAGSLRYTDARKGKKLDLREATWHTASTSCGSIRTALIVGSLRAGTGKGTRKRVYDAALTLGVDKHRAGRFTLRLGRSYTLTAALAGGISITCPPKPGPHKPSYKAPSRTSQARKASHGTATKKTPARRTTGRPATPKGSPSGPPHRAPSH